jgi:hypothetical protein
MLILKILLDLGRSGLLSKMMITHSALNQLSAGILVLEVGVLMPKFNKQILLDLWKNSKLTLVQDSGVLKVTIGVHS